MESDLTIKIIVGLDLNLQLEDKLKFKIISDANFEGGKPQLRLMARPTA